MKLKVYTIRDSKAEIYNTPFFQRSHGEAERTFIDLVNDPKSKIHAHAEDYHLHYIGEYDDQTGQIDPTPGPQHIVAGSNVRRDSEANTPFNGVPTQVLGDTTRNLRV